MIEYQVWHAIYSVVHEKEGWYPPYMWLDPRVIASAILGLNKSGQWTCHWNHKVTFIIKQSN
jgi:hypothetical protein